MAKTMHSASEHGNNGKRRASVRYPMKQRAMSKRTLKLHGWVSSLFQVRSSLAMISKREAVAT
jgi:hypothetical protein